MTSQASSDERAQIRKQVWNNLYDRDELSTPTLPYNIVPNFKTLDAAVEKLLELDVVKGTERVLLSMEKLMLGLRVRMLQEKGVCYVVTHKSGSSPVCKISAPTEQTKFTLRQAANLFEREKVQPVEVDQPFDVIVVSSIAVTSTGTRMGRTDLLSELEFALLSTLGYVGPSTTVVSLVHDLQVVDGFAPSSKHPLPLDLVVTPSKVLKCERQTRADKVNWSSLRSDAISDLAILRLVRYQQWKEGVDVRCEDQDANPAELEEVVLKRSNPARRVRPGKSTFGDRKEGGGGGGFFGWLW